MKQVLAAALAAFSLGTAQAVPTVTVSGQAAGQDSSSYSASAAIGSGNINDANTLFVLKEKVVGGLQSWLVFADPSAQTRFNATLTFNVPIVSVVGDRAGLVAGNALYGIDVDGDGLFNDYADTASMGLEGNDLVTWTAGGNTLTLDWRVQASGDMMRVTTAVPEPASLALLTLGLLAMGLKLRGQRRT